MKNLPELWQHQKDAISRAGNRFALHFDPGTGKTRTAIELYLKHKTPDSWSSRPLSSKVIIFAPLNVCRNWEIELKEYLGTPFITLLVAGQTKARKIETLKYFNNCPLGNSIFLICNIESLRSKDYRELLGKSGADFIIVDESHNFKTPSSLQTKGLFEIEQKLKPQYLYLLTGTPAPQGEMDLYTSFRLLKKTNDNFFVWRKKHFNDLNERRRGHQGYYPKYVVTKESKEYFQKLLGECSVTAKKDEVLDLPELLHTNIYAEMSPEQRRHYETMLEFLFAIDAEGNELNAANFLSRSLRLQQILAGFLGDVPIKDNPRLQALDAAIEKTQGEQFIVWTIFKATYKQLQDRIISNLEKDSRDSGVGMLTGEQSAEERAKTIEQFQAGRLRALIAHPRAGGVGVNLTAASYSIHYTKSFSLVDDLQCEARNYRGGSEIHKRITRIDIITPGTIDEEITSALKEKKSVQDFILGLKEQHGRTQQAAA